MAALALLSAVRDLVVPSTRSPGPPRGKSGAMSGSIGKGTPADAAMERYARGDDAAFLEVYDAIVPRLYGYLLRQTRDAARAEDLVQQTLLHMHRARGRFIPGAEVVPWAFAIARRLLIDGLRRGRREVLMDGDEPDAEREPRSPADAADDLVQAQQLANRIRAELGRLPEQQRVAFELVKQEGLSLAEAAQVLGTTVAAVKLRAHRAYEALRAVLGDTLEERGSE
jgi:RNA polymerase sigma-70 factor (ECF subfamily)